MQPLICSSNSHCRGLQPPRRGIWMDAALAAEALHMEEGKPCSSAEDRYKKSGSGAGCEYR